MTGAATPSKANRKKQPCTQHNTLWKGAHSCHSSLANTMTLPGRSAACSLPPSGEQAQEVGATAQGKDQFFSTAEAGH